MREEKSMTTSRVWGWIKGNNLRIAGYFEGRKGNGGENWYTDINGSGWSQYDVDFRPDPDAEPAPQPAPDAESFQCDACGKMISEDERRGGIRAGAEGTFCPECCGERPAPDAEGEWVRAGGGSLSIIDDQGRHIAELQQTYWDGKKVAHWTPQEIAAHAARIESASAVPLLVEALKACAKIFQQGMDSTTEEWDTAYGLVESALDGKGQA